MPTYYDEQHRLKIDPKRVMIFTLKDTKSKFWYVRIRKKKGAGYFQKSLRTENKALATEMAKNLYMEMWSAEAKGVEFIDARFGDLFIDFVDNSGLSKWRSDRARGLFKRYFSPFFGNMSVSEIDGKKFNEYLRWRSDYWQERKDAGFTMGLQPDGTRVDHIALTPSETTLKHERQMFKQFLYWCSEHRYIDVVPHLRRDVSSIAGVSARKGRQKSKALTKKQEERVERLLRRYCIDEGIETANWMRRFARARLYYFIYICRHTLIRPSTEATGLLWSDIEYVDSRRFKREDGTPYKLAMIHVRDGKGGKPRVAVMPYGQVELLTRWHEFSRHEAIGFGKTDDYVFPSHKGSRIESHLLGRLLRNKLKDWGEDECEATGLTLTLYSIARHTAITRRIERCSWDVGQIATAAGTSIKSISSAYYQEFVRAEPDRWAVTFRSGVPIIEDKKAKRIYDAVAELEELIEDDMTW